MAALPQIAALVDQRAQSEDPSRTPIQEPTTAPSPARADTYLYGRVVPIDGPPPAEEFPFFLAVDSVYEGPLDVLLALVRKQDLDIFDLPIAKITAQFLAFVATFTIEDVEMAAEFTYMTALLVLTKTRMLLPIEAAKAGTGAKDDPRRELVDLILEHERFKMAAAVLKERHKETEIRITAPGMKRFLEEADPETLTPRGDQRKLDLPNAFRKAAERAARNQSMEVEHERVTVADMLRYLRRRLATEDGPVFFDSVLGASASAAMVSAAFLALLEMSRVGAVYLRQNRIMGPILIKKAFDYDDRVTTAVVEA